MIDPSTVVHREPTRQPPWPVVVAALACLGLLTAVAATDAEPVPAGTSTISDDTLTRQFENEGLIPRPAPEDEDDVTRRLVNEGRIPDLELG